MRCGISAEIGVENWQIKLAPGKHKVEYASMRDGGIGRRNELKID